MDNYQKDNIANNCLNNFEWNKNIINSANALIIVLTENGICGYNSDGSFSSTKGTHWQSFDAGLATQTLCLSAHALGLGTVILGLFNEEKIKNTLNISDKYSISALVAIGYSAVAPSAPQRKSVNELLKIID